jgi:DNA-binding beta-propeller fold protein YncE
MPRKSRRPFAIIIGLVVLALVAAAVWLLATLGWFSAMPTPFGWPVALTIVAGDGRPGDADGVAAQARFGDPFAIVIDSRGALYVADAGDTGSVRRIDRDGTVTTLPGKFDSPSGLALDRAGDILVADTAANTIRKISPDGTVTTLAGDGTAGYRDGPATQARFNGPIGLAADADGNVYVADSYNDRIRVIAADGQVRTLAGQGAPGLADGHGTTAAFDTPTGIALDRHGMLLVADSGNNAVRKVTPGGDVLTLARTDAGDGADLLSGAVGLASTWDGFIYIASYKRGRIVQLSPSGALRVLTGPGAALPGNAAVRFIGPAGLAIDQTGALYVADASARLIARLSPRRADTGPVATSLPLPPVPALVHARAFPWPVAPQMGWHEVVGDLGEVRGNYQGESRDHLHAGLDISAPPGETVLAAAAETVRDPLPNWDLDGLGEGLRIDAMTYIHMRVGRTATGAPLDPAHFTLLRDAQGRVTRVRVKRGTRFRVGDPLGTINRMAHVHLELGAPRGKVNALLLHFPGFADHVAPHIENVQLLDAAGLPLTARQDGRLVVSATAGPVSIVADAWDQVDNNAARRRLGLYAAGFQILDAGGTPVRGFERPRITIAFDRMPDAADAAKIAYAPASGDTVHSEQRTRFLYVVSNVIRHGRAERVGWNPATLPRGDYTIRIYAADHAGNVAVGGRDLPITIR